MSKVLIITYYWPPAGGPGVQRLLKFAKYLPEFGWDPIILTVKKGNFPAYDGSLLDEVPSQIKVYKTTNYEPDVIYRQLSGSKKEKIPVAVLAQRDLSWKKKIAHWIRLNLFIPDAKIGWIKPALKTAEKICFQEKIDLIMSSSPPPTTHLIARKLKQKTGIKWIADFRDPWTKIHYYRSVKRHKFAIRKDEVLEKSVLTECNAITTASRKFQELLPIPPDKIRMTITNGFDEEVSDVHAVSDDKFTMVHTGGLSSNRYYEDFFRGLKDFLSEEKYLMKTRLLLVGNVDHEIVNKIREYVPERVLEITGYLPHQKAVEKMQNAAVNLIFLEQLTDYKGHIPGKIFEYIKVKRQILGAGDPEGDAAEIIRKSGCGEVYPAGSNWRSIIQNYFGMWKNNVSLRIDQNYIDQFHRRKLTEKLSNLMNEIL